MSSLIDRQAAIDAVHSAVLDFFDFDVDDSESPMTYHDEQILSINKAITTKIKSLPPVERKKGRWVTYKVSPWGHEDIKCSECGRRGCSSYWDFCPACGADMRGEGDE